MHLKTHAEFGRKQAQVLWLCRGAFALSTGGAVAIGQVLPAVRVRYRGCYGGRVNAPRLRIPFAGLDEGSMSSRESVRRLCWVVFL